MIPFRISRHHSCFFRKLTCCSCLTSTNSQHINIFHPNYICSILKPHNFCQLTVPFPPCSLQAPATLVAKRRTWVYRRLQYRECNHHTWRISLFHGHSTISESNILNKSCFFCCWLSASENCWHYKYKTSQSMVKVMVGRVKVMVEIFCHTKILVGSWWDLGGNHKLGEIKQ